MKNQIPSGILLCFNIPRHRIKHYLEGGEVRAWKINMVSRCPGAISQKDGKRYFPNGATLIMVDPDRVEVREYADGTSTLQKKGAREAFVKAVIKASKKKAAEIIRSTKHVRDFYAGKTDKGVQPNSSGLKGKDCIQSQRRLTHTGNHRRTDDVI
jgi:hypothetical protein